MKAQELRIENWLKLKNSDIHSVVEIIHYEAIKLQGNGVSNRIDKLEGIPLTQEWLIKSGFKEFNFTDKETGFILKHKEPAKSIYIRTSCEPNIKGFFSVFNFCECSKDEIQFIKKVDFVHQLQNLYFALTGQELEIN